MNLFIRTSIAPYRVDFYNALHEGLDMRMCFYHRQASDQHFDQKWLESLCRFKPVYLKGIRLGSDSRKICFGLWKLVREARPEVVIVPEFQLPLYQLRLIRFLQGKHFRIVSLCDDSLDMIRRRNDFSGLHRWLRAWAPRLLDGIIVPHPGVRDWYQEQFGIGTWMPIIGDETLMRKRYEALLPRSREYVKKYQLDGKKVVLFVGRLVSLKRVDLLLKAFSRVERDAVLVIVGDGPEKQALQELAGNDRVIFTGRLEGDDLYAWYNVADVLALISSQEAFGAVVNEAFTAGVRVVVSDHAGASCLVDGTNGEVVTGDSPEDVRNALERQMDLCGPHDGRLRPDLMPVRFKDMIDRLLKSMTRQK